MYIWSEFTEFFIGFQNIGLRGKRGFLIAVTFCKCEFFLQKVAGLIARLVGSNILERTVHNDVNAVLFANCFCKNFAINIIFLLHYGAKGSSLACWIELKALSKLFGQQMVREDGKSWNLDGRRWTWMIFRAHNSPQIKNESHYNWGYSGPILTFEGSL